MGEEVVLQGEARRRQPGANIELRHSLSFTNLNRLNEKDSENDNGKDNYDGKNDGNENGNDNDFENGNGRNYCNGIVNESPPS